MLGGRRSGQRAEHQKDRMLEGQREGQKGQGQRTEGRRLEGRRQA